MQFANIATLIEVFLLSQIQEKTFKDASLYLYVTKLSPFTLQDTTKMELVCTEKNAQVLINRERIKKGSSICLEKVKVHFEFQENYLVKNIELTPKSLIINIGQQENRIQDLLFNFEPQKTNSEYLFTLRSFQYIRRLQRKNLVKSYYKPGKIQARSFFANYNKKNIPGQQGKYKLSPQVASLDAQSISLLQRLIHFTDKNELFRIILKIPVKGKETMKVLQLAVVPTEVLIDSSGLEFKKRQYNRQTITQLLEQYKAKEQNKQK